MTATQAFQPSGISGDLDDAHRQWWTSTNSGEMLRASATASKPKISPVDVEMIMDSVIDHFDFCRVHKVMTLLDWKWANADGSSSVPSVLRMKGSVRRLMRLAMKHWEPGTEGTASGGFQVRFDPGDAEHEPSFSVSFCVTELYSDELEGLGDGPDATEEGNVSNR